MRRWMCLCRLQSEGGGRDSEECEGRREVDGLDFSLCVCVFVCVLAQALVHSGLEENQSKTPFEFSSKIRLHNPF